MSPYMQLKQEKAYWAHLIKWVAYSVQNSAEEEFEGREGATKQENVLKLEPPVFRMRRSHTFIFIPIS